MLQLSHFRVHRLVYFCIQVDKYKPTSLKKIIGQSGDKSNAKKLLTWLNNWERHRRLGTKPASSCKLVYAITTEP